MKKLFVGNLPYSATEQQVHELFANAGIEVDSVSIIRDRFSGEPRGFGFVEINNDDEAERAAAALNGQSMGGRSLVVNEARPMQEGGRGGGGGGRGGDRGGYGGGGGGGRGGDRDRGGRGNRY